MPSVNHKKLNSANTESSANIRKRVNQARQIQLNRYQNSNIYSNADLTPKLIEKYCQLDQESNKILNQSFQTLNLSARAYAKILKVARTIADLDNSENIEKVHLIEAIQYRSLDRI